MGHFLLILFLLIMKDKFSKTLTSLFFTMIITISTISPVLADSASNSAVKYDGNGNRHGATSYAWVQRTFSAVSPQFTTSGNYYFNRNLTRADKMTCTSTGSAWGFNVWGNFTLGGSSGSTITGEWSSSSWCGHSGNISYWGFPQVINLTNASEARYRGISIVANTSVARWF